MVLQRLTTNFPRREDIIPGSLISSVECIYENDKELVPALLAY